jgi:uncharacterized membrane protein YccC
MKLVSWLGQHDRGYVALRRAARTAIVMPALFAVGYELIGNPEIATFAAFGAFALLLLVDFGGPMRERLQAQAGLSIVGGVFICVATLASRNSVLAAVAMAVAGFAVLFAGVVSSVLAGAATSLLLAFILPVSLSAPVSAIPDRLAGWGMASAASFIAVALLWPAPAKDPLKAPAILACRAMAARLRSDFAYMHGGVDAPSTEDHERVVQAGSAATDALQKAFVGTPYRPTGLSTATRTMVRLVDELTWLNIIVVSSVAGGRSTRSGVASASAPVSAAGAVKLAAAEVLEQAAGLLEVPDPGSSSLDSALTRLRDATSLMEQHATIDLPVALRAEGNADDSRTTEIISSLEPTFRAQELAFATALIARNIELTVAAQQRTWLERLLGRQPEGVEGPWSSARARAGAHAERHSVWLHNSLRGAAGLGLAVLVANLSGVQHSFWVVLGTLSVLRSNALNTGQNVLRGILGTTAGFAIGAAVLAVIGTDRTILWFLLPLAILVAGVAPAAISFAAGQAAFTVTLVILFNIIEPAGWRVGLLRVEDITLGCAVSFVVGGLFWPRGARAALRRALAEAYVECADYLANAVEFGLLRCDASAPSRAAPREEALRAAAASRRLDDTFRTYLAERGAKPVPLAEVTTLVTGVAGLRLTGDAVLDLWQRDDGLTDGDRAAARTEILLSLARVREWYDELGNSLLARTPVRDPVPQDDEADSRLVQAVRNDLGGDDGLASATAVRMIWTGDHLDAARRLQLTLAEPARNATSR